jgi:hypothetical protein
MDLTLRLPISSLDNIAVITCRIKKQPHQDYLYHCEKFILIIQKLNYSHGPVIFCLAFYVKHFRLLRRRYGIVEDVHPHRISTAQRFNKKDPVLSGSHCKRVTDDSL